MNFSNSQQVQESQSSGIASTEVKPVVHALDLAHVRSYGEQFAGERANQVAVNASTEEGMLSAATSFSGICHLPHHFSIELVDGRITNQRASGRCWMFAGLNTLRYEMMHAWDLEDFEFSGTYLYFWATMEKANTYLDNILATLDEPVDRQLFRFVNADPVVDGGVWDNFAQLVDKYGLVPRYAYPESANSENSEIFKQYLKTKLREGTALLRKQHAAGASMEDLLAIKQQYMDATYNICTVALGEPPEKFDYFVREEADILHVIDKKTKEKRLGKIGEEKNGTDDRVQISHFGITPREFYQQYVPANVDDFVTVVNVPMESTPFMERYSLKYSRMLTEAADTTVVNLPLEKFKAAALAQLQAGHPISFASDVDQFSIFARGILDRDTVNMEQLFGFDFKLSKADGLEYNDCASNHAMMFTGVDLGADGKPTRWKVENSWGIDSGDEGYYVASDEWFDDFVTELDIRTDFLDEETRAVLGREPIELDPWHPLSRKIMHQKPSCQWK